MLQRFRRADRRSESEHDGSTHDSDEVSAAPERRTAMLARLTRATQLCTAELFAHSAVLAGRPENASALRDAGWHFGRIAHLADAIEDLDEDRQRGKFNPLAATGTSTEEAYGLLRESNSRVEEALWRAGLAGVPTVRWALLDPLTGVVRRMRRAVRAACSEAGHTCSHGQCGNSKSDRTIPGSVDASRTVQLLGFPVVLGRVEISGVHGGRHGLVKTHDARDRRHSLVKTDYAHDERHSLVRVPDAHDDARRDLVHAVVSASSSRSALHDPVLRGPGQPDPYGPQRGQPYQPGPYPRQPDPYPPQPGANPYGPHPGREPYAPQPGPNPYGPTPGPNPYGPTPGSDPYRQPPGGDPNRPQPGADPYGPGPGDPYRQNPYGPGQPGQQPGAPHFGQGSQQAYDNQQFDYKPDDLTTVPGGRPPAEPPSGCWDSIGILCFSYCTGYACCAEHRGPCKGERHQACWRTAECDDCCCDCSCDCCCDTSCDCCCDGCCDC
ncbi:hypothetical protein KO481_32345 [Nocardia sp. NEAU-G5]|uniref:DUF222 domain-containing protein n=1 Tax=Nocardia albiluteola TaxID=2842303 RepID=A0ABS6B8X0_9NOCA|nr:DUF5685 family protein [Nocardia albiluteola]MBU3066195.1 hypothetical protein [Nocardia albiluteola]